MEAVDYCPKCGIRAEGGKYCRSCGTNLVAISKALEGAQTSRGLKAQGDSGTTLGLFSEARVSNVGRGLNNHTGVAVFGSVTIDLAAAPLPPGETKINVIVVFGGLEILVPADVGLRVTGVTVLADVKSRKEKIRSGFVNTDEYRSPNYHLSARRLHIDATAVFGEVKIKR
jgi:hypothetical protein